MNLKNKISKSIKKVKGLMTAVTIIATTVLCCPSVLVSAQTSPKENDYGTAAGFVTKSNQFFNAIAYAAIGALGSVGTINLVKGIMELGSAISARDQEGTKSGALQTAGGIIMVGCGAVIAWFKFK